jgi:threonine dehydrogenase-like Zn-dependent dehydrogenase
MNPFSLQGIQDFQIYEGPKPVPGNSEALLRVAATGICGSGLLWFSKSVTVDVNYVFLKKGGEHESK